MNPKILKAQNPNKKKLLIIKDSMESLQQTTETTMPKTNCFHEKSEQKQRRYEIGTIQTNLLPPINPLNKSRISISLPPERAKAKLKYSLTSTTKLLATTKSKQPSLFGNGKNRNLKIQDIINGFIQNFISRDVFHLHFGKYLVQPKDLFRILLFTTNSFNNSKNINTFQKNISDFGNYEELIQQLERDEFTFSFMVRNNKKLSLSRQNINERIQNEYRTNLETEGQLLANKNQQLLKDIMERRGQLERLQNCIGDYHSQVSNLSNEIRRLNSQIIKQNDTIFSLRNAIMESEKIYERLESNKKHFSAFMINFNQNKFNEMATCSRRLQQDLCEYVQYLNFHPLGRRGYQKSKYTCDLQKMLLNQQRQFCKYIAGQPSSLQEKVKLMRNFINKIKDEYNTIINQLLIVIQEKTDFISKFTKKISAWHQNHQNKKTMLAELNRVFQFQLLNLEEMKMFKQCGGNNYSYSKQTNTEKEMKIINVAEKIVTIYQIASSFI